jgi:hypothetical protein
MIRSTLPTKLRRFSIVWTGPQSAASGSESFSWQKILSIPVFPHLWPNAKA